MFCQVLPSTSLKKFDLSSCRFNDPGLLKLIDFLPQDKTLSSIKLADNFFSEQVEPMLLDALTKNTHLTDVHFQGNRFSHSLLQKLKRLAVRNTKQIEEQEPNKLKAEIYRLRYEHTKLEEAKGKLSKQKQEIENVRKMK